MLNSDILVQMLSKKILQIGKFYPPNWGGIETVTFELHNLLDSLHIETHVFGDQQKIEDNVYTYKYFNVFRVPVSFKLANVMMRSAAEKSFLLHLPNPFVLFVLIFLKPKHAIKVIWHAPALSNSLLMLLNEIIYILVARKISEVIVPYPAHKLTLPKAWQKISIRELRFPIGDKELTLSMDQPHTRQNDRFSLSVVGRLVDYKNHGLILKALAEVKQRGFRVFLNIVGDGPLKSSLQNQVSELGLEEDVFFRGAVSEKEKNEILANTDCLVLVSKNNREMLGVVQYEAYCRGIPAIVSQIPFSSVSQLADESEAAIVIPLNDYFALADAITGLIQNPKSAKQLSKNGQEFIKESFNKKKMLSDWGNVFKNS